MNEQTERGTPGLDAVVGGPRNVAQALGAHGSSVPNPPDALVALASEQNQLLLMDDALDRLANVHAQLTSGVTPKPVQSPTDEPDALVYVRDMVDSGGYNDARRSLHALRHDRIDRLKELVKAIGAATGVTHG